MANFAENLFGGGRVLRTVLFLAAAGAFCMFLTVPILDEPLSLIVFIVVESTLLLLALAMLAPRRFHWAGRALSLLVFLAYVAYVVGMWLEGAPVIPKSSGEAALGNALLGLIVIGLPALVYALRTRSRPEETPVATTDHDEDDEGYAPWRDEPVSRA